MEADGCIAAIDRTSPESVRQARDLIADRFKAYQHAHERWLPTRPFASRPVLAG